MADDSDPRDADEHEVDADDPDARDVVAHEGLADDPDARDAGAHQGLADRAVPSDDVPDPIAEEEVARIVAEEEDAARRLSAIEAGRRKGGVAGAAMAGAMLAISEIVEGPKRDEMVAVSESPGEPDDIDLDGITVDLDGREYWAPPPDTGDLDRS